MWFTLKPCVTPFWHPSQHLHWSLVTWDSKPTHMEMCLVSNITWHILLAKNVPSKCHPEADHLLYSWLFWISRWWKPHNCGHGNHQHTAHHSVTVLTCLLRNILIIPRKWLHLIWSRGYHLAETWWLLLGHFLNKSSLELKYSSFQMRIWALPVVINLDCCVKTLQALWECNLTNRGGTLHREPWIFWLNFYWHFKPTT